MGLGKQLVGQSSYGASQTNSSLRIQSHGAVSSVIGARGTVGWQAPEVMVLRGNTDSSVKSESSIRLVGESTESSSPNECTVRTSRSVDIFSLGCVFYTTLVPGSHPFGEWYEREANIMHDRSNTQPLQSISMEAFDLVGSMLNRNPKLRPTAKEVCDHPFFWEQDRKLSFLCDISDRIEMNGIVVSEQITSLSVLVERCASNVVGHDWSHDLDEDLVSNVQRFRSYNTSSVRDLLRLIRNKHHHFEELPKKLKDSFVSSVGLMIYFEMKFPKLLIHVYDVVRDSVACDDVLARKYAVRGTTRLKEKIMEYKDECRVRSSGSSVENQPIITTVVEVDLADENANGSQGTDSGCKEDESPILKTFEGINAIEVSRKETGAAVTTTESCGELQVIGYRGWYQHEEDWISGISKRRDQNLLRCRDDNKFRTRLCNHWDVSLGTTCPLKKKSKCIFAHGPIELRVKEGKRTRWGTLVDADGNCKNPKHSGGEDTYGAARSIESERKEEGKWNIKTANNLGKKKNAGRSKKQNAPYPTIEA
jgi:serine/threonine-protein kinase/endoribonuclease IRE1